MENIQQKIDQLHLEKNITLADIPNIDLYVDQVLQLFESTFRDGTRNKEDKILTKTMINNYAKGKVLLPIQNKKYTKENIMLLSLIYELKGAISINDIKKSLGKVNEKINTEEDFHLETLYDSYLKLEQQNIQDFKQDMDAQVNKVKNITNDEQDDDMSKLLLMLSLVNMSNMYRRLAEQILDETTSV